MTLPLVSKQFLLAEYGIVLSLLLTSSYSSLCWGQTQSPPVEASASVVPLLKNLPNLEASPSTRVWAWAHRDLGGRGELIRWEISGFKEGTLENGVAVVRLSDYSKAQLTYRQDPESGGLEVNPDRDEQQARMIDAFLLVNWAHQYFSKVLGSDLPLKNLPITIEVDSPDVECGAEATGDTNTLAFAPPSRRCRAGVEPSAVFHEYTHLVDRWIYGESDNDLAEGLADMAANFISRSPIIPAHEKNHKGPLRTADNKIRYNSRQRNSAEGAIYYRQAQAWSGFAWHAREALIAKYGSDQGQTKAEELFFAPLRGGTKSMQDAVDLVFYHHSPDGISSHGEDFQLLKASALRHGLKVP